MFESVKGLEIKTSILFKLVFAQKCTILSCSFLVFFIINLYFLIHSVITQIFNPITEFLIALVTPIKEVKAEIKS